MVATLRSQFVRVHAALTATSDGAIAAACARYGLLLVGEDVIVNGVLDARPPLALSTWRARTGMSELPPIVAGDRRAWAARVRIDVSALRDYAVDVYAATEAYLGRCGELDPDAVNAQVLTALLRNQRVLLRQTRAYSIC